MLPIVGDRRWTAAALVAAASFFWAGPVVSGERAAGGIRDLYYGETLFHFYQQDHFTALTHLMAARSAGRIRHHADEAELLLGGLYLSYGQHRRAGEIFARLLSPLTEPAVRNHARFFLGKVRYRRGLYRDAIAALEAAKDGLPAGLAAERTMLLAQSHLALGEPGPAARVLADWNGPDDWVAYARFNLGVALAGLNRADEAVAVLDRVGRTRAATPELADLRDKANVALGFAYLQRGAAVEARDALGRVRVEGPFSTKALLGAGWAEAAGADYRAAITPWLELRDRDLLDSAVQESLLAIPYAMQELGAFGSAAEYYRDALAAYAGELQRLDDAIARAGEGRLVPALLHGDNPDLSHWGWSLDRLPGGPDSRYLYHVVADHDFHEGLRNTRDLVALRDHLDGWRQRLTTFRDMIDTQKQAFARRLPDAEARLAAVDIGRLRARRDALAARIERAAQNRAVLELVPRANLTAWRRLVALEESPAWKAPEAAAARDKQRLLKGILLWDADREFKYRLWQQRRELSRLDSALADARPLSVKADRARAAGPRADDTDTARIDALERRLDRVHARVDSVLREQQRDLHRLAAAALQAQRQRLAGYEIQARFALATIYDRASAANREAPE